jgi:hypothetical protein
VVKNKSVFLNAERSQARSNHIIICRLIIAARDTIRIVDEALYVERSVMAYSVSVRAKKKKKKKLTNQEHPPAVPFVD